MLFHNVTQYVPANCNENEIDVLMVDEAHRMTNSSNNQYTPAEKRTDMPQVETLIRASKVAVFFIDEDQPYYRILDINGACTIPSEVMTDAGRISIGVFGVLGDTILTSAIVKYKIVPGAIIRETEDVTPELWEQILQAYQSIAGTVSDLADIQAAFINNASQVIRQVEDALMTIQGEVSDMDGGVPSTSSYDTDIDAGGAGGD